MSALRVSQTEHDTLNVARALVGDMPAQAVEQVLIGRRDFPPGMGPTAIGLLRQILSCGMVAEIMRRGGWRRTRCLDNGGAGGAPHLEGRLWERHGAPSLAGSAFAAELCRWLASGQAGAAKPAQLGSPRTLADEILTYLALHLVRGGPCETGLASETAIHGSCLAWLGFADILARRGAPPKEGWDRLARCGYGAVVVEALQDDLARRWIDAERSKRGIRTGEEMRRMGAAQEAVLGRFMDAADAAGRRDLAGFIVQAGRRLVAGPVPAAAWTQSLEPSGTLAQRAEARRAAGSFLRALVRWRGWDAEHRNVRYIDDGYAAAQAMLSMWEPMAPRFAHVEAALREMASLDAVASPAMIGGGR